MKVELFACMIYAEWNMLTDDEDLEIQEFYYANGWQVSKPMKYTERLLKYWIPVYEREKVKGETE